MSGRKQQLVGDLPVPVHIITLAVIADLADICITVCQILWCYSLAQHGVVLPVPGGERVCTVLRVFFLFFFKVFRDLLKMGWPVLPCPLPTPNKKVQLYYSYFTLYL